MHKMKKLKLGLTMAGAVSAGAYTAGVIDYLLETLDAWEAAKDNNRKIGKGNSGYDPTIPMHDVVIEVMSGASAGGITSIVAAAALQQKFNSITSDKRDDRSHAALHQSNPLYNTWVNLTQDDMVADLFSTNDVTKNNKINSLLNSSFKETIAQRVLNKVSNPVKRSYIADELDIIVTLTSLNGIPFELGFSSNANNTNVYRATSHRDFAHFKVGNSSYTNDGRIPIDFTTDANFDKMRIAAMATGAFPIGLSARKLAREKKYVQDNPYINPLNGLTDQELHIPNNFETLNSDGGILNNEPFDVARKILASRIKGLGTKELAKMDIDTTLENDLKFVSEKDMEGTIIMIDPFPSEAEVDFDFDDGILSMVSKVLGAMRGELLFKKEDLQLAYNENNYSRFMIAPKRSNIQGSKAIACGSLGGFGGFFHKEFRKHDFYLGRRNAQYFLRKNFAVSENTSNPVVAGGYTAEAKNRFLIVEPDGKYIPIIPDLRYDKNSLANNSEPAYKWPVYPTSELNNVRNHVSNRSEVVLNKVMQDLGVGKVLSWSVSKVAKGTVAKRVVGAIEKDFKKHGLI